MKRYVLTGVFIFGFLDLLPFSDVFKKEEKMPQLVTKIEISRSKLEIPKGKTLKLKAIAKDKKGKKIKNVDFNWISSSTSTAIVDSQGRVTALKDLFDNTNVEPEIKIIVSSGNVSATATIICLINLEGKWLFDYGYSKPIYYSLEQDGRKIFLSLPGFLEGEIGRNEICWTEEGPVFRSIHKYKGVIENKDFVKGEFSGLSLEMKEIKINWSMKRKEERK